MSDKITKYFTNKAEKVADKGRVLRFIGSDEGIDRDGEQIMLDGWDLKEYKENPVVLFGHDYKGKSVATGKVWKDNKNRKLMFDLDFAAPEISSEADSLFKLYEAGVQRAVSVGFMPDFSKIEYPENKDGKGPYRVYKGQTLLEISLCAVPSNPRGLLVNKSMDDAIKSGVVDQLELDELLMCFKEEKKVETKIDKNYEKEIAILKAEIEVLKNDNQVYRLFDDYKKGKNDRKEFAEKWIKIIKNRQ